MKVNKVQSTTTGKIDAKKAETSESITFSAVMATKRSDMEVERLNKLVADIEEQGKILAESSTVEDLKRYKSMVKEFMDDVVKNGVKLQQSRGFNRGGRTRIYKIVSKVDEKLMELSDAVLKRQEKGLNILKIVGEIKGLLVDIYT